MKKGSKTKIGQIPKSPVEKKDADVAGAWVVQEEVKTTQQDMPISTISTEAPSSSQKTKVAEPSPPAQKFILEPAASPSPKKATEIENESKIIKNVRDVVDAVERMMITGGVDKGDFPKLMKHMLIQAAHAGVGLKAVERLLAQESKSMDVAQDQVLGAYRGELKGVLIEIQGMGTVPPIRDSSSPPRLPSKQETVIKEAQIRAKMETNLGVQVAHRIVEMAAASQQSNPYSPDNLLRLSEDVKAFKQTQFKNNVSPLVAEAINKLDQLLDTAVNPKNSQSEKVLNRVTKHIASMGWNTELMGELQIPY